MIQYRRVGYMTLALGVLVACDASAHASLVKSAPARDAVLLDPPAAVTLWFDEPLESAFCALDVLDGNGKSVAVDDVRAAEARGLTRALDAALPPGAYRVRYRVLSVDGHVVEGELAFEVAPVAR